MSGIVQAESQAIGVAGDVEAARHARAHGDDDVAGAVVDRLAGAMAPGFDFPEAAVERRQSGELGADLGGDAVFLVALLPGVNHVIFVDVVEVQGCEQRTAGRPLQLVAAAVVRLDHLFLGVVANALHQVVVVDDQTAQAVLPGAHRGGGPGRPAARNDDVDHLGQRGRALDFEGAECGVVCIRAVDHVSLEKRAACGAGLLLPVA